MRLAQYLAHAGITSRRKAEILIAEGKISVNGMVVRQPATDIDPEIDQVYFEGRPVFIEKKIYLLLNKPSGVISSVSDPHGRKTVIDLLPELPQRIYPVGRLDYETQGLLLLSNDGYFTNLMLHPRYEMKKTYQARVSGRVKHSLIEKLRQGIKLEDGWTAPAQVHILHTSARESLLEITLHEGRKRQVRRMCQAIGHPVIHLERTAFAFLTLKGVAPGSYRYLNPAEVNKLIGLAREGQI
ncbi:MAG TPA: rRNA pseudouridine synthase [Syntrophomonadaceae bacterium]|jgi:23S rRNA pseudouridine2605 synthase|nr:rRNA pseudouridine synthase [Syntrophomonadaceae bacterium]